MKKIPRTTDVREVDAWRREVQKLLEEILARLEAAGI